MPSPTKHCWVANLKTNIFLANSKETVRIMGVLSDIREIPAEDRELLEPLMMWLPKKSPHCPESESDIDNYLSVTIDDGTDSIAVWAHRKMMKSPTYIETDLLLSSSIEL